MPDAPRPDIPAPRSTDEFAEPLLRVSRREAGPGVVVVQAEGELEALTADALDERVREQLAADRDVVLDLDGVTFMASSGIAVLLGLRNESGRRGARLHLTGSANRAVARPVQVLGLESVLPLQRDSAAVIADLPHGRDQERARSVSRVTSGGEPTRTGGPQNPTPRVT